MKVAIYNQLVRAGATRREVLRGAASVAALAATSGMGLGALTRSAAAQADLRALAGAYAETVPRGGLGAGEGGVHRVALAVDQEAVECVLDVPGGARVAEDALCARVPGSDDAL